MWTSPKITPVSKLRNGKALRGGVDPRVTGMSVARVSRREREPGWPRADVGWAAGLQTPHPCHSMGRAHMFFYTNGCGVRVCTAFPLAKQVHLLHVFSLHSRCFTDSFADEETEAQRDLGMCTD